MVKFVELENGRLFNAAHILEIGAVAKINYESDTKLRVVISIRILGTDGSWRDLINEGTVMPFRHEKLPEWFYDFVGSEIEKLEESANDLLTHIFANACVTAVYSSAISLQFPFTSTFTESFFLLFFALIIV